MGREGGPVEKEREEEDGSIISSRVGNDEGRGESTPPPSDHCNT